MFLTKNNSKLHVYGRVENYNIYIIGEKTYNKNKGLRNTLTLDTSKLRSEWFLNGTVNL